MDTGDGEFITPRNVAHAVTDIDPQSVIGLR